MLLSSDTNCFISQNRRRARFLERRIKESHCRCSHHDGPTTQQCVGIFCFLTQFGNFYEMFHAIDPLKHGALFHAQQIEKGMMFSVLSAGTVKSVPGPSFLITCVRHAMCEKGQGPPCSLPCLPAKSWQRFMTVKSPNLTQLPSLNDDRNN